MFRKQALGRHFRDLYHNYHWTPPCGQIRKKSSLIHGPLNRDSEGLHKTLSRQWIYDKAKQHEAP